MVLGVPLAKFIPELFKAASKPFVNVLKKNVPKSPFWKDRVFVPMAQYYNKQSVRVRLWTQGIRRDKSQIEKSSHMTEEAAVELGAEIVANTVTFGIGLVAILMNQSISAAQERKKAKKEESQMQSVDRSILELQQKILDLGLHIEKQDAKLRKFERTLVALPQYAKLSPEIIQGSGGEQPTDPKS